MKFTAEEERRPESRSLQPAVREQWPGEIETRVQEPPEKPPEEPRSRVWLLVLFAGLLVAFTIYGMANGNQSILDKVFELIRYGLSAGVGFEVGRTKLSH